MTKTATEPSMRKAIIKKNKSYKFGQSIKKGEAVLIKEEFAGHGRYVYTAFRTDNDTLGFVVTRSEFEYTDKQKFVVLVTRISYSSRNIEVEAIDRKEAEQLATEEAGNHEFPEHDAEYKVDAIHTEKEHKNLFK